MEKIQLTIDGREVTGGRGQTILEIARENGIDIPYLCYHPRVSKTGACRICIVRINDQMLKTSCTEPATNGMKVDTEDAEIIEIRKGILELLLSEGDHNCLYCDANGECELQALCFRYGVEQPSAGFPKNARGQDYVSSQGLKRNENRCVLCGRCVKACGEIQMNSVWDFA
ncbi:MAG: formate dehydrogenase subunit alpha, partial [Spirochaetales bacterium]